MSNSRSHQTTCIYSRDDLPGPGLKNMLYVIFINYLFLSNPFKETAIPGHYNCVLDIYHFKFPIMGLKICELNQVLN